MSVAVTVVAPAAPAETWRRWSDFARWPEWNPTCAAAHLDGPLAAGTTVEMRLRHPRGGREFLTRPRLTRVEPPAALDWQARGLGFRADVRSRLEPEPDGTRLTLHAETTGAMAFTYLMTLTERAQAVMYQDALTALSRALRAGA
ncbi:MAG: SRPBCC family protein [Thermoleophilia bacterium]|jgi:uncharacterized protein YndB with AHSA1/START domain|nr:SRPBCC family protein [Thermoleophilia bacterium]